ncbi:proprotein convertase subtilisin/kexin type 4-like [Antedon mediterranea]|uniref:proprotein convertase subtilisin/kexin type 4-like n=1 Tax=Antedon mediterranea TaxID=105859 RepID=UPI003AF6B5B6
MFQHWSIKLSRHYFCFAVLLSFLNVYQVDSVAIYTNTYAVHVEGGKEAADAVATMHGFINMGEIVDNHFHFIDHRQRRKRYVQPSRDRHYHLRSHPHVKSFEQQTLKSRTKRGGLPGIEPDSKLTFIDPDWRATWYLNRGNHRDMNVIPAWEQGYTGRGVVVSILDDGLEKNHPDLETNYDSKASYDVNDHDNDPQPRYDIRNENRHGTRCAGEVAAEANNNVCSVGVAYNANIGGVRMLDGDVTDAVEARSLAHQPQHVDIYSASWGPDDDGKTVDGPGKLARQAFKDGALKGRGGLGSIFVWASGNGGRMEDSCNCDGYTNTIYTLSVSSVSENGKVPWYSERCASTLATTYSSGSTREKQVVTVDLRKGCTKQHSGTSASAPLAAAICALALEANPNLTWRDLQHIVVNTARPEHLDESDWITNGAGFKVSHSYGFGLMDASAMVDLALRWPTVPPMKTCSQAVVSQRKQIKGKLLLDHISDGCAGTSEKLNYLEKVHAVLSITFPRRGDLVIHLTSPMGTSAMLLPKRPHDASGTGFSNWEFMSTHTWGEQPQGKWTLQIENKGSSYNTGFLTSWTLKLYGTETVNEPLSEPIAAQKTTKPYEPTTEPVKPTTEPVKPTTELLKPTTKPSQSTTKVTFTESITSEKPSSQLRTNQSNPTTEKTTDVERTTIKPISTTEKKYTTQKLTTKPNPSTKEQIATTNRKMTDAPPNKTDYDCTEGYYREREGTCNLCHPSCHTCMVEGTEGCIEVKDVPECRPVINGEVVTGSYLDVSTWQCRTCLEGCLKCNNYDSCLDEAAATTPEVAACSQGFFLEIASNICKQCHSDCTSCTGPNPFDCILMKSTTIDNCPDGTYLDHGLGICQHCHQRCFTCYGGEETDCLQERPTTKPCPEGKYRAAIKEPWETGFKESCLPCHKECSSCLGAGVNGCTSRRDGSSKCQNGFYLKDTWCKECHESCSTCYGGMQTECIECSKDYTKRDTVCVLLYLPLQNNAYVKVVGVVSILIVICVLLAFCIFFKLRRNETAFKDVRYQKLGENDILQQRVFEDANYSM